MRPWTVQEYAKHVKLDEETITRWCRLGKLKARRFGNRWRIYNDSFMGVEKFSERKKQVNTARNFDYFRIGQAMERVGVSENQLRKWAAQPDGPTIIRMNNEILVWMRYSEVESYIERNSTKSAPAPAESVS